MQERSSLDIDRVFNFIQMRECGRCRAVIDKLKKKSTALLRDMPERLRVRVWYNHQENHL